MDLENFDINTLAKEFVTFFNDMYYQLLNENLNNIYDK